MVIFREQHVQPEINGGEMRTKKKKAALNGPGISVRFITLYLSHQKQEGRVGYVS